MLVNADNLATIRTNAEVAFNDTLEKTPSKIELIASPVDGKGKAITEIHLAGLTGLPREWVDERWVQNLASYKVNATHQKFEQTVGLPRDDIERDNLGMFSTSIRQMAQSAQLHPWRSALTALMTNGFSTTGLDGQAFFSAAHTWPGGYTTSQDNRTDEVLDEDAVNAGVEAMMGFKGPDGDPLDVAPTHFIGAVDTWKTARDLFFKEKDAAGADNGLFGLIPPGNIIIDARITTKRWALLDCSKIVKPCAFITEAWPPELASMTKLTDETVFTYDQFKWGTRMKFVVLPICWWLAYGSDGSE